MRYKDARKLHNEDEIIVKSTGASLQVVGEVEDDTVHRDVFIRCTDGNLYHHRDVR